MKEFHYRLPHRAVGARPGAHPGTSLGTGLEFVSHMKLHERPDPRRLDLRASVRSVTGEWLVRVQRQRAAVPVQLLVDVSASMRFGTPTSKLEVVADFAEALGHSAFRTGDALGMQAFDSTERVDLFVPAMRSRGVGSALADMLRRCESRAGGIEGLEEASLRLAGRQALVFLVSDFHWPLARLGALLDRLTRAFVVPVVVWDASEVEPPAHDGIAALSDAETGARRTLWLRAPMRSRWRAAVAQRRAELDALFAAQGLRPFRMSGAFDADAMSSHFLEADT